MFSFFILTFFSSLQESSRIEKFITKETYNSYGKYNSANNKIIYFGISLNSSNELTGTTISYKDMGTMKDSVLRENTFFPPVGWIDKDNVLIFERQQKNDGTGKWNDYLCKLNIYTKILTVILPADSIKDPDTDISINNGIIVYRYDGAKQATLWKYNLLTNEKSIVEKLAGKDIRRFVYSPLKEQTAFIEYENKKVYIKLLNSDNIITIEKLTDNIVPSDIPLCISDNGKNIYYTINTGSKIILKDYNIETTKIRTLYGFEKGITCLDLAMYENKLMLSLKGVSEQLTQLTSNSDNSEISIGIDPKQNIYFYKVEE